jgi:hypothetical protein
MSHGKAKRQGVGSVEPVVAMATSEGQEAFEFKADG